MKNVVSKSNLALGLCNFIKDLNPIVTRLETTLERCCSQESYSEMKMGTSLLHYTVEFFENHQANKT